MCWEAAIGRPEEPTAVGPTRFLRILFTQLRVPLLPLPLISLSLLFFACVPLPAQHVGHSSSFLFGGGGGYEIGKAFGEFPVYNGGSDSCGLFNRGIDKGLWGGVEGRFPGLFGSDLGLALRLSITPISERFTGTPVGRQTVLDSDGESLVELDWEHRFALSFTGAALDFVLLRSIGNRFTVRGGPFIGYRFSPTFEQYDTVLGPEGFLFDDGTVRRSRADGIPFTLRPFAFGLVAGGGYKLPIGERFFLEPDVTLRLDFQGPVNEMRRSALTAGFGLSLYYDALPHQEEIVTPIAVSDVPTLADPVPEKPTDALSAANKGAEENTDPAGSLAATLDVYALDSVSVRSDTAVIPMRAIREHRFISLLPRLYFDRERAEIPARYQQLSPDGTSSFVAGLLAEENPARINSQLLNIVGKRLQDNPGTSVHLLGSVSIDEPSNIAEARVRVVAAYLGDVWKIEPSRIVVAEPVITKDPVDNGTEQGREEQRYVQVELTPDDLAAPVIVEQMTHEFSPPSIKLVPHVDSEDSLDTWQIVVRQGGTEVARYSNEKTGSTSLGIPWNTVAGEGTVFSASLVAELSALDRDGRRGTARDTLPVIFVPEDSAGAERERLVFILPGSWGESISKRRVAEAVANVVERLRGGERIRITPRYSGTDRFATERSLAYAKAFGEGVIDALTARGISVADIVIEKSADDSASDGTDSPEHRIAGRGIVVVVDSR